jgi:hypothetical protein
VYSPNRLISNPDLNRGPDPMDSPGSPAYSPTCPELISPSDPAGWRASAELQAQPAAGTLPAGAGSPACHRLPGRSGQQDPRSANGPHQQGRAYVRPRGRSARQRRPSPAPQHGPGPRHSPRHRSRSPRRRHSLAGPQSSAGGALRRRSPAQQQGPSPSSRRTSASPHGPRSSPSRCTGRWQHGGVSLGRSPSPPPRRPCWPSRGGPAFSRSRSPPGQQRSAGHQTWGPPPASAASAGRGACCCHPGHSGLTGIWPGVYLPQRRHSHRGRSPVHLGGSLPPGWQRAGAPAWAQQAPLAERASRSRSRSRSRGRRCSRGRSRSRGRPSAGKSSGRMEQAGLAATARPAQAGSGAGLSGPGFLPERRWTSAPYAAGAAAPGAMGGSPAGWAGTPAAPLPLSRQGPANGEGRGGGPSRPLAAAARW